MVTIRLDLVVWLDSRRGESGIEVRLDMLLGPLKGGHVDSPTCNAGYSCVSTTLVADASGNLLEIVRCIRVLQALSGP